MSSVTSLLRGETISQLAAALVTPHSCSALSCAMLLIPAVRYQRHHTWVVSSASAACCAWALLGHLAGNCEKYHSCSADSFQGKADPRKGFLPLPLYGRNGMGSLEWLLDSQGMCGNQPKENPNPLSCLLVYGMPKLALFFSLPIQGW